MGWKDRAIPVSAKGSSWRDRAVPIEVEQELPSQGESFGRSAANTTLMGFSDELAGIGGAIGSKLGQLAGPEMVQATRPELQEQLDQITPAPQTFGAAYDETRDQERARQRLDQETNPWSSLGGSLAGGLAGFPIGGLKGAAATGAAYGLGESEADSAAGLAKDVGFGATGGSIGHGIGSAIQKGVPALYGASKDLGRKAMSAFLGPSEEAILAREAGRARTAGAKSFEELAEEFPKTLKGLSDSIDPLKKEAIGALSEDAVYPREQFIHRIDEQIKSLKRHGTTTGSANKNAENVLESIKKDVNNYPDMMSEVDLEHLIKSLDNDINWKTLNSDAANKLMTGLRKSVDTDLKARNKAYRAAMAPVARRTKVHNYLKNKFGLVRDTEAVDTGGLVAGDNTSSRIKQALKDKNKLTQKRLDQFKEITGRDYLKDAEDFALGNQFEKSAPNGSRRALTFGSTGAAIGGAVGGMPGAVLGGAIGGSTGAMADYYGGKMAGKIIDMYSTGGIKQLRDAFGKFAPALEAGLQKSPKAFAVTLSILSQNPEFKKIVGDDK